MEEFRTITARRAHHVGIALASLPWARRHHPALLSRLISFLLVLVTAGPGLWPNQGNRQVQDPPPAHHHPAAKIEICIDYARPWTSRAASVKLSGRLQAPHWRWHPRKCPDLQRGRTEYGNVLGNWVTQSAWCVLPVRLWACVPECLCGCVRVSVCLSGH